MNAPLPDAVAAAPPAGSTEVVADIEDVVVALSMTSRARQGVAT